MNLTLSHHAYAIIGTVSKKDELCEKLASGHNIVARGNPDFFDRSYQTFTIDDARDIKSLHETRPVTDEGKKIFILLMNGITVEAQNALLKLLEEPADYAHFFLIIPSAHLLLGTVKSRMQVVDDKSSAQETDSELKKEALLFTGASAAARLEIVKSLIGDIDKEKKTKQDAIDFLDAVEEIVYEKRGIKEGRRALEAIDTARKYIHDRAPSVKMLLEFAALTI